MIGYRIGTQLEGPVITQELVNEVNDVRERIWLYVIDTSEAQIREKLIELGWTPPVEKGERT